MITVRCKPYNNTYTHIIVVVIINMLVVVVAFVVIFYVGDTVDFACKQASQTSNAYFMKTRWIITFKYVENMYGHTHTHSEKESERKLCSYLISRVRMVVVACYHGDMCDCEGNRAGEYSVCVRLSQIDACVFEHQHG